MEKDFDSWNKEKKLTDSRDISYDFFYHEREVWWCAVGINVGVETNGKNSNFERPILIVKKFNKDMFWGVPLTSIEKIGSPYIKITHNQGISWAILSQLKTFSVKRLLRKVGMISENDFKSVNKQLRKLL
jgi:mRNA interferase MazF